MEKNIKIESEVVINNSTDISVDDCCKILEAIVTELEKQIKIKDEIIAEQTEKIRLLKEILSEESFKNISC